MGDKPSEKEGGTYSSAFAFVYIFNLIVGVGALALPKAFSNAGLVLGTILLILLCFVSYMTTTYMIEAMAAANAYIKLEQRKKRSAENTCPNDIQKINQACSDSDSLTDVEETTPLVPTSVKDKATAEGDDDDDVPPPDDYEIEKKFEMGTMANMFYHPIGIVLYYICICLYLYGDLSIYAVAIPKSFRTAVCKQVVIDSTNITGNITGNMTEDASGDAMDLSNISNNSVTVDTNCFGQVTQTQAYYIFLAVTVVLLCPWTFFNLTKSKYLQLLTTILRNVAFFLMVVIAIVQLGQGNVANPLPPAATVTGFPVLFGVSIYAFMCQHSLPGMITPMRTKKNILILTAVDFALILVFYLLLAFTGAFRFRSGELNDLYTLNFFTVSTVSAAETTLTVIGYYLALFPVFTLSTNFPIISITLRENLKALARFIAKRWIKDKPFPWLIDRILFPIVAVAPPIIIAFATENVEFLVSITGSFPGIGVQYVIPATLAFTGRYIIKRKFGKYDNAHKSPFGHIVFFIGILIWTVVSVGLVIADDVIKIVENKFFE